MTVSTSASSVPAAAGEAHLGLAKTGNIVALCDVDDARAANAYKRLPNATRYPDFRVMLEKQGKNDRRGGGRHARSHARHRQHHGHALGKHCYCEKPLTHDVWEARQMKNEAAKNSVATQMGNQGTATTTCAPAVEIMRAGAIGDVREMHVWTNRPIWPQGISAAKNTPRRAQEPQLGPVARTARAAL